MSEKVKIFDFKDRRTAYLGRVKENFKNNWYSLDSQFGHAGDQLTTTPRAYNQVSGVI